MNYNFKKCLEIVLHHEGGYVDHPKDPGGATKYGVTLATAIDLGIDIDRDGDTDKDDIKLLEPVHVEPVYKQQYWNRMWCDDLPDGLDLCVFDWGVNSGTSRAIKKLQTMVNAFRDGRMGPNTLKKVLDYVDRVGLEETINDFQDMRQDFYENLSTFNTFGKGWTRRQEETRDLALEMAYGL